MPNVHGTRVLSPSEARELRTILDALHYYLAHDYEPIRADHRSHR